MTGLGHGTDGALCAYDVFHETALVEMPEGLSFVEAITLPCAGLTAPKAFGLPGVRGMKRGMSCLCSGRDCFCSSDAGGYFSILG